MTSELVTRTTMKPSVRCPAEPPPDGVYPREQMPPSIYHRAAAWSQSTIKMVGRYDRKIGSVFPSRDATPKRLRAYLDGRLDTGSDAKNLGTAFHCAVLEPERFEREYFTLAEKIDRRTTDGKAQWARLVERYGEDQIITADGWANYVSMIRSLAGLDPARKLIGAVGQAELSVFWTEPTLLASCKIRLDKVIRRPDAETDLIIDLKSTKCVHPDSFGVDAARYGYDIQAAFGIDAWHAATGRRAEWLWIAVETGEPYDCAVYTARPEDIESARVKYRAMLERCLACDRSGRWPGAVEDVMELPLPEWAYAEEPEPQA